MQIVHLGVGEAFDTELGNNSHLIIDTQHLLLDCGYQVPTALWKYRSDPDYLDMIWISHLHADHCFGLPAIIVRMMEEKRRKPLKILTGPKQSKGVINIIEQGYPRVLDKCTFPLQFDELLEKTPVTIDTMQFSCAQTKHSVSNYALRIDSETYSLCYSGDGGFTTESSLLYQNSDVLIHEGYRLQQELSGHSTIMPLIEMAHIQNVKHLFLTHIQRDERRNHHQKLLDLIKTTSLPHIHLPEKGEIFTFP